MFAPVLESAVECHLLKWQRLQNKVLRTIGNFPKRTSVRDMHKAFHMPYVYDYITKSCRQQAEVIQNHENVPYSGQGEARHRKYKRLKLNGGHVYGCLELISSAVGHKQTARGRSTQFTDSDPVTSTSELLLMQNSVTAHARLLASDHCATENHRPESAVRTVCTTLQVTTSASDSWWLFSWCGGGLEYLHRSPCVS
jgi:hypothetical protein